MDYSALIEKLGSAVPFVAIGVLLLGLALWLLGRLMAKPACVISGLFLGGIGGTVIGHLLADQGAITVALVIGGALAGALLAGLLFRLWMGVVGAAVLALVAPTIMFIWQGAGEAELPVEPATGVEAVADAESDNAAGDDDPFARTGDDDPFAESEQQDDSPFGDISPSDVLTSAADAMHESDEDDNEDSQFDEVADQVKAHVAEGSEYVRNEFQTWWDGLATGTRGVLMIACAVGAIVGLIFGVVAPLVAASFQSALVGAGLVYFSSVRLVLSLVDETPTWLPQSHRHEILIVGLITLVGFAIQWTAFRKKTDK